MSAHLQRAQLLLAQSRPADAEREAMQALAREPNDAQAHALLALARADQQRPRDALSEAQAAVGLAPDVAYFHHVHAVVLHRLDREADARRAIEEAIRLDPEEADHFALLASIELAKRNPSAALSAADQALALDPEHVNAANLRSMALVQLGRKAEAMATVGAALERAPGNALSHANQGWNCLHRNDPRRAQEHFREALRLDPDLEYARQGMLEALKARNPIYRGMLAYYLWIGRQSTRLQWAFIAGTFFGGRIIRGLSAAAPGYEWFFTTLLVALYAFIYLSWTAGPVFNLALRLDRFGRHVLSRDERIGSNWFGAAFLATLGMLSWWLSTGSETAMLATIQAAIISICVAATIARAGRSRLILGLGTAALATLAVTVSWMLARGDDDGMTLNSVFIYGFIGLQLAANALNQR